MGVINCCGVNRGAISYRLTPDRGSVYAVLKIIKNTCPHCHKLKVEIDKIDCKGEFRQITYENAKAEEVFNKLYDSVLYEIKHKEGVCGSAFYLNYSEFGKKKKCFSNLSSLKMGKFDNFADLPKGHNLVAV